MNTTTERISNICRYNQNLINVIERKLCIYKRSYLAFVRYGIKNYKEDMSRMYAGLEAIKDVLGTMNIELIINYNNYTATFHDLNNDFEIEIQATT